MVSSGTSFLVTAQVYIYAGGEEPAAEPAVGESHHVKCCSYFCCTHQG